MPTDNELAQIAAAPDGVHDAAFHAAGLY